MNFDELKKSINSIHDAKGLFLLAPLSDKAGFFASGGKLHYMVKDDRNSFESIETDYLRLHTHVDVQAVANNPTFVNGYYNIIVYLGELEGSNAEAFVNLCEIHALHQQEMEFKEFFYSLISLFQLPAEQSLLNAVGLYGELKYMQYAKNYLLEDISGFWHARGPKSRFDFSNSKIGIEVKTSIGEESEVMIKHQQLFGELGNYLAYVQCELADTGESISEVIDVMNNTEGCFDSIAFSINLARELRRISPTDLTQKRFKVKRIQMYDAERINPFAILPDSVSKLTYHLDLSDFNALSHVKEIETVHNLVRG